MDSIRVLILQKVFSQCAKMLDPRPDLPPEKRLLTYYTETPVNEDIRVILDENDQPKRDSNGDPIEKSYIEASKDKDLKKCVVYTWPEYTGPRVDSEYYRIFRSGDDEDSAHEQDIDFHCSEPETQAKQVIQNYVNCIRFGTGPIVDYDKRGLLPGLFLETGTDSYSFDFRGIEQAKEGEVMPIVLRLWTKEPKPSRRRDSGESQHRYKQSNPIFIAQFKEQLDYLLDRNEFIGISIPRIGYSLPSSVHDCRVRLSQTLQGIRAPFEAIDFRFEVTFSKQKEIDDRYDTGTS